MNRKETADGFHISVTGGNREKKKKKKITKDGLQEQVVFHVRQCIARSRYNRAAGEIDCTPQSLMS